VYAKCGGESFMSRREGGWRAKEGEGKRRKKRLHSGGGVEVERHTYFESSVSVMVLGGVVKVVDENSGLSISDRRCKL